MPGQPLDPVRIEQVGGVLNPARHPVRSLRQTDGQVEFRGPVVDLKRTQDEAGQLEAGHGSVLQDEKDLEQGRVALVALRLQRVNQFLQRQVLVPQRAQDRLSGAPQQFAECRVAGQVRAQDDRVQKIADDVLQLFPRAIGDGRPEQDVLLSGIAFQQSLQDRQQGHEQCHTFPLAQVFQRRCRCLRQRQPVPRALKFLDGGTRTVGRQVEDSGRARQLAFPVIELTGDGLAFQPVRLPRGIVRVLDGQLGQRRRLAGRKGAVERGQFADEYTARPTINGNVMGGDQEQMIVAI